MDALSSEYAVVLEKIIKERFINSLPPLLAPEKFSVQDRDKKQVSRGFSAFVLNKKFDLAPQVASQYVVDDYEDNGIDAFFYDDKEEILYLIQSKFRRKEMFSQNDANEFCKGVRLFLRQEFHRFNVNFQHKINDAEKALENCSHIKLIVAYTGNGIAKHANDSFQELFSDPNLDDERLVKNIEEFNPIDLKAYLLKEQEVAKIETRIRFIKYQKSEQPKSTVFGMVWLKDLINLHQKYDKGLYQKNIRFYLGSGKSGVNNSIKNTLKTEPDKFFYFNNGITAVCDTLEFKDSKNGEKYVKLRGFSIVNGAQTVASSAEFYFENPDLDISSAKVLLTIIHAPSDSHFEKNITKSRNHQNPVQLASFAALDDEQERLRKEIALIGVNYHYRPEVDIVADDQNIHRTDVLRALACLQTDSRLPAVLKLDIARVANPDGEFYSKIFTSTLTGFTVINAVSLYKKFHEQQVNIQNSARGFERLVYRHSFFIMLYVFMKKFSTLISKAEAIDWSILEAKISIQIDELRQQCLDLAEQTSLNRKGALAFFRNQTDAIPFLVDLMANFYGLSANAAVIAKKSNITGQSKHDIEEEYPRQELIEYMNSKAPQITLGTTP